MRFVKVPNVFLDILKIFKVFADFLTVRRGPVGPGIKIIPGFEIGFSSLRAITVQNDSGVYYYELGVTLETDFFHTLFLICHAGQGPQTQCMNKKSDFAQLRVYEKKGRS